MMDGQTRAAFERLLDLARSDTGQARIAANFVLAWWNAGSLGAFDIAELFSVDRYVAVDMARVFSYIADLNAAEYPTEYRAEIEGIIGAWRPDVWAAAQEADTAPATAS